MNKPKPTNKTLLRRGRKTKIETIFEETVEVQTMDFMSLYSELFELIRRN